jgi:hypothetical protein
MLQMVEGRSRGTRTESQSAQEQVAENSKKLSNAWSICGPILRHAFAKSQINKREEILFNDLAGKFLETVTKATGDVQAARSVVREIQQAVATKETEIQTESISIDGIRAAIGGCQNVPEGISQDCSLSKQSFRAHSGSQTVQWPSKQKSSDFKMKMAHLSKELKVKARM